MKLRAHEREIEKIWDEMGEETMDALVDHQRDDVLKLVLARRRVKSRRSKLDEDQLFNFSRTLTIVR